MTEGIDLVEEMLTETNRLIAEVRTDQLDDPTPCTEYNVRALLDHVSTWIQVFDRAVNERPLDFDPATFMLPSGWAEVFATAASAVVAGLRARGYDRAMTMTADPIPGSMVFDMLTMEYIGHGLDLARATSQSHRFTESQAMAALAAAARLIQPEYRGMSPGQFHPIVDVEPGASTCDRYYGFIGRDPAWAP
jgi:uncharacterized protein (TIGR03086 family)